MCPHRKDAVVIGERRWDTSGWDANRRSGVKKVDSGKVCQKRRVTFWRFGQCNTLWWSSNEFFLVTCFDTSAGEQSNLNHAIIKCWYASTQLYMYTLGINCIKEFESRKLSVDAVYTLQFTELVTDFLSDFRRTFKRCAWISRHWSSSFSLDQEGYTHTWTRVFM